MKVGKVFMGDRKRVYTDKINVNSNDIREFYDRRAMKYLSGEKSQYTTVLLGDSNPEYAKKWHKFERDNVLEFLNIGPKHTVLDIGCGIGRWAENVLSSCSKYVGTDFSKEMIQVAVERYKEEPKAKFLNTDFQSIYSEPEVATSKFDTVIIAGVSMYINDSELKECYKKLLSIINADAVIYIEESVGVKERLTLNHIWSDSLDDNYNAIYRTRNEYLELLGSLINECEIVKEGFFEELDKKELSETSHWYVIMKYGRE